MKTALVTGFKQCLNCHSTFKPTRYPAGRVEDRATYNKRKFCSRKCRIAYIIGTRHPNWKGGTKTRPDGYIRDSKTDKYIHRLVMEEKLGRELLPTEHIHHINGNKKDNRVENLEIHSNSEHRKIEAAQARRDSYGRFSK